MKFNSLQFSIIFAIFIMFCPVATWSTQKPEGHSDSAHVCESILLFPESAVELELRISEKVTPDEPRREARNILAIVTTSNGLVSGLIETDLQDEYEKAFPHIAYTALWSDIAWEDQFRILKWLGKNRKWNPESDKPLHSGLLLNVDLPDFKEFAADRSVHMGDLLRRNHFDLLEIHLRSGKYSASQLLDKSFSLMRKNGISKQNGHQHVVGAPPQKRFAKVQDRIAFVIHYRNANLAAEMISLLEKNMALQNIPFEFGTLTGSQLKKLMGAFSEWVATGTSMYRAYFFKLHYVAFRFSDFYDGPKNSLGFEFRTLSENVRLIFSPILDYAQKYLNLDVEPQTESQPWYLNKISQRPDLTNPEIMQSLYYRQDNREINLKLAPPEIQELEKNTDVQRLLKHSETCIATQMLFYDWSADPLFFNQSPMLKSNVRSLQLKAFQESLANPGLSQHLTKTFLRDSGIYNLVLKSVSGAPK